ncbi:unnamed protein product [Darwinula stevensoni]|uniref:Conserved oligomeric Golgi complex subunit 8 n=1 Tax=Darwinula stevensoni TaxID=69355 RepID=A0A7R9ADJ9_9CRUS|nr:unnamed protein product [Darwinula stevensoni]CAG0901054.1 unnamed protein product [Darwinula stevensoni]
MEQEQEKLLSMLFDGDFPDHWKDDVDVAVFLRNFASLGIDQISREPDQLKDDKRAVLQQTQDLAFSHYKTFIRTAHCSKDLYDDMNTAEKKLEGILNVLPQMQEKTKLFIDKGSELNGKRRLNSLTLAKHTGLLELLELPQIMESCVRSSYYEEALELSAFVKRLEKKHSHISAIAGIVKEVQHSNQMMLMQLLTQLRKDIQLPQCLKVIGYIRRMDVFSETQLRIKFLQARNSWLSGILSAISRDDRYHHMTRTLELYRVHLFDILTQYRALFSEDPQPIFTSFLQHKVSELLKTLEEDLLEGGGNMRTDSLLGQAMYFGLSLSRMGGDFRALLPKIFQDAAIRSLKNSLADANMKFQDGLSLLFLNAPANMPCLLSSTMASSQDDLHPPLSLLEFYPLAEYTNSVLGAFNDLRLCCPLSCVLPVTEAVTMSLEDAASAVRDLQRQEESSLNASERELLKNFIDRFSSILLPYIGRCFQALFPLSQLSSVLGVSPQQLKAEGLGILDEERVRGLLHSTNSALILA